MNPIETKLLPAVGVIFTYVCEACKSLPYATGAVLCFVVLVAVRVSPGQRLSGWTTESV